MLQERWDRRNTGHRVHIYGPSGAGTSTLGRALATVLASQHFDTDDFYWMPTVIPFTEVRPVSDRIDLMQQLFVPRKDWVLSGSLDSWGEPVARRFTLAVRLTLDPDLRRRRLELRESRRCGCGRGWGEAVCERCSAFLAWADGYESGDRPGRSLERHRTWEKTLDCPVVVLDAARPVETLVAQVLVHLDPVVALS